MTMHARTPLAHLPVAVIGGGQAGLSISWYLRRSGIDHIVFEKRRAGHAWRAERWDTFCLVTPNWQCQLPGFPYNGPDPHGFMLRDEIVAYFDSFVASFNPPLREGVAVTSLQSNAQHTYTLETTEGTYIADQVVIAAGGYQIPIIPRCAERLPADLVQIQSSEYRNPDALPDGAVLVVGSGQSGCQIAEDLHIAGRKVYLRGRRCAASGAALSRQGRGRVAAPDGLLRPAGARAPAARRRARQDQPLCDRARRRARHRSASARARGHGALRPPARCQRRSRRVR